MNIFRHSTFKFIFFLVLTIITTTLAGLEWTTGQFILDGWPTWDHIKLALQYSLPFLGILTVHEFGHYFVARYHKVMVTLPLYIPFWFGWIGFPSLGTMGAFIRIKQAIDSKHKYFDIGVAGPVAGFVAALVVLYIGFTQLPPIEYIYAVHPEYLHYGAAFEKYAYQVGEAPVMYLNRNLIFQFFEQFVATHPERLPNVFEIIHYPWLFAGYLALFFTALNLLPIGQLDGGHILYGLIGKKGHAIVSRIIFVVMITYGGLGFFHPSEILTPTMIPVLFLGYIYFLHGLFKKLTKRPLDAWIFALATTAVQLGVSYLFPTLQGNLLWLIMGFFIGRFLGIDHPDTSKHVPLSIGRQIIGWVALLIFVGSFTAQPFAMVSV